MNGFNRCTYVRLVHTLWRVQLTHASDVRTRRILGRLHNACWLLAAGCIQVQLGVPLASYNCEEKLVRTVNLYEVNKLIHMRE